MCGEKALEETFAEVLAGYQCFGPDAWHCLLVCCWFQLHRKPCQWGLCAELAAVTPVHIHEVHIHDLLCITAAHIPSQGAYRCAPFSS